MPSGKIVQSLCLTSREVTKCHSWQACRCARSPWPGQVQVTGFPHTASWWVKGEMGHQKPPFSPWGVAWARSCWVQDSGSTEDEAFQVGFTLQPERVR